MPIAPGTRLGPYEVLGAIGTGVTQVSVILNLSEKLKRRVPAAIK